MVLTNNEKERLMLFGLRVLALLEEHTEGRPDTLDEITASANEFELIDDASEKTP